MAWQQALPEGVTGKRAESTLTENARELAALKRSFGVMQVGTMEKADAYEHLDACLIAKDKTGNARPRPEKGNKEIALARVVLEWGVRKRWIRANPFDGVKKLVTPTYARGERTGIGAGHRGRPQARRAAAHRRARVQDGVALRAPPGRGSRDDARPDRRQTWHHLARRKATAR